MDNWRQDKYAEINKALERIQRRADKVARAINALSAENQGEQQQQQQQQEEQRQRQRQQQQVLTLTNELARLQDMSDRLFDFRDRLYFYSNLGYVEALNEWQYEIQKVCVKAAGFVHHDHHPDSGFTHNSNRRNSSSHHN